MITSQYPTSIYVIKELYMNEYVYLDFTFLLLMINRKLIELHIFLNSFQNNFL